MSDTVIAAIIALAGVITSATIAHFTARATARNEMKRLQMQFDHEDAATKCAAFQLVYTSAGRYADVVTPGARNELHKAVAAALTSATDVERALLYDIEAAANKHDFQQLVMKTNQLMELLATNEVPQKRRHKKQKRK